MLQTKKKMLSFLLGLVIGVVSGFVGGVFYYARKVYPTVSREIISRDSINALVQQNPKGDFIQLNPVTEYIKNTEGEILLGDVLEDDRP